MGNAILSQARISLETATISTGLCQVGEVRESNPRLQRTRLTVLPLDDPHHTKPESMSCGETLHNELPDKDQVKRFPVPVQRPIDHR